MIKVLLIDDSEIVRVAIGKYLPGENNIAVITSNGEEAMEVIKNNELDVVLVEYFIKINGGVLKLIEDIKARYPRIKILGYSDIFTEDNENLFLKAGASAYLDKSLSIKEIRDAIIALMI